MAAKDETRGQSGFGRRRFIASGLVAGLALTAGSVLSAADEAIAAEPAPSLPPDLMLQEMRQSKGGGIGTGGRGAIALRFDDGQDAFKASVFKLLAARGLPFSYATISDGPDAAQPWWTANTTWADYVSWIRNGGECWCHGKDHRDPTPQGYAGLVDNIVTARSSLEGRGLKVQGWSLPGCTALTAATPYGPDGLKTLNPGYTGDAGKLILSTWPLSEAYAGGAVRPIPCGRFHGLSHCSTDGTTLANLKSLVDSVAERGLGLEIMCHPQNLNTTGNLTLNYFTQLLDYIVAKRDSNQILVLTPSGLMFADKSTSRLDLLGRGDFEGVSQVGDAAGPWSNLLSAGATLRSSNPHGGTQYVSIPAARTGLVIQRVRDLQDIGVGGETFVLEGWARSNGSATTTSRVVLQDYSDPSRLNLSLSRAGIGTSWTKVVHAFSLHPLTSVLSVALGSTAGDGIDWDDLHIWKV